MDNYIHGSEQGCCNSHRWRSNLSKETPEEIAKRLLAPNNPSGWWTHDQVRALIIEAAESAPSSAGERKAAWAALRMITDAIGELFGPLAPVSQDEHVPSAVYHQEAELIIAALQRVADRLALSDAAAIVGGSAVIEGEHWTGEAHELAEDIKQRVKAVSEGSDGQ